MICAPHSDGIGARLDSEIDELEKEVNQPAPDAAKVARIPEVLRLSWSAKEAEIELRVRKMITELGIIPIETGSSGQGGAQTRQRTCVQLHGEASGVTTHLGA